MKDEFELKGYTGTKSLAFIGFVILILGVVTGGGVAAAAIGIGLAVIPYVFFKVDFCRKHILNQQKIIEMLKEIKNV
jgi:hypothetical protein